jgi:hypothetical protein
VIFGSTAYTVADGTADFSAFVNGNVVYVSIIVSGSSAVLSKDLTAYNSQGIPLWKVTMGASAISSVTDERTWVQRGAGALTSKFIIQTTDSSLPNAQVMASLGTGIVKNTTGTGVQSIATAGSDYQAAITATGILKGAGGGSVGAATAGTDYQAPLTILTNYLSSDVSIATTNTYYNGPSVTLSPGTWDIKGGVTLYGSGGDYTVQLWDGTNVGDSGEQKTGATSQACKISLACRIVITSGTPTWSIAAASTSNNGLIKAACPHNPVGNTASNIIATKVGP